MGIPLWVATLVTAAIVAALIGLNGAALRVYLRERRFLASSRLGKSAWMVTIVGAFSGPFAPLLALVGGGMAWFAIRRAPLVERGGPGGKKKLSPLFPLPRSPWGEGGPELPARMALSNAIGIGTISAVVVAGVYFSSRW